MNTPARRDHGALSGGGQEARGEQAEADRHADAGDGAEPDHDVDLAPVGQLEVVVQRHHPEHPFTGGREEDDLITQVTVTMTKSQPIMIESGVVRVATASPPIRAPRPGTCSRPAGEPGGPPAVLTIAGCRERIGSLVPCVNIDIGELPRVTSVKDQE